MKLRLIWNSTSTTAVYLTRILLALVMAPFYLHQLGTAGYGLLELILGIVGYLSILELGSGPALIQFIAVAHTKKDHDEVNRVFSAGLSVLTCVGLAGALAMAAVAISPRLVFGAGNIHSLAELRAALLLFGLNFLLNWPRIALSCYLMGMQEYATANFIRLAVMLGQALANWIGLSLANRYLLAIMAATAVIGTSIQLLAYLYLIRKGHKELRFALQPSWHTVRGLFGFGAKSALLIAASSIFRGGLLFVVARTVGVGQLPYFGLPSRLVDYAEQLWYAMSAPLEPHFAEAFVRAGVEGTRNSWVISTRLLQMVGFGSLLGITWLGLPFLSVWLGPQYGERGRIIMVFLCMALFMQVVATNGNRLLIGTARHGRLALVSIAFSLLCLGFAYTVVRFIGIDGAAVGYFAFVGLESLLVTVLTCRFLKIRVSERMWDLTKQFLFPLAMGSLGYYTATLTVPPSGLLGLGVDAAIGSTFYFGSCLLTSITAQERGALLSLILRRWRAART